MQTKKASWAALAASRFLYSRITSVFSHQYALAMSLSAVSAISTSQHIQIRLHFCTSFIFLHFICWLIGLNSAYFPLISWAMGGQHCTQQHSHSSWFLQICKQSQNATWQFSACLEMHVNDNFCGLSHFNICSDAVEIMCQWGGEHKFYHLLVWKLMSTQPPRKNVVLLPMMLKLAD